MNDDTQESGRRGRYFRYAVFALSALLVLSLGFVLTPREPEFPAAPPFTEQARASAFSDILSLRAAGTALKGTAADSASGAEAAALDRAVTLLTVQARALMVPSGAGTGSPTPPSGTPPAVAPPSIAGFAGALQASAARRLKDAGTADGGMARLLAGAGTAQLLAAEDVAAAGGTPLTALPAMDLLSPAGQGSGSPTGSAAASCPAEPTGDGSSLATALAAAVAAERELVYAYQAALVRLDAPSVPPASDFLVQHRDLGSQAEQMSRAGCAAIPAKPAGYSLGEDFLAAPAAALGTLEASTLPVYADLVAVSEGPDRAWALAALQAAARRTLHWGGSPGPLPGLDFAAAQLPHLSEAELPPGTAVPSQP